MYEILGKMVIDTIDLGGRVEVNFECYPLVASMV